MNNLERVFEVANDKTEFSKSSYIESYPYLIEHFANIETLTVGHVVAGAHMIYGWMPTILHINKHKIDLQDVVIVLQVVKDGRDTPTLSELELLKKFMNNSVVGTSKMLHFVNPTQYPIWDSKICRFTNGEDSSTHRVSKLSTYLRYREKLHELMDDERFAGFHRSIETKIGYQVSGLRALELAMFVSR